jgi:hypothetical protein
VECWVLLDATMQLARTAVATDFSKAAEEALDEAVDANE